MLVTARQASSSRWFTLVWATLRAATLGAFGNHHDPRGIDHGQPFIECGKAGVVMVAGEVE